MSTWSTLTHIVGGADRLVAQGVILTLVLPAGRGPRVREHGVQHWRYFTKPAGEAGWTHARVRGRTVHTRGAIDTRVRLTVIDVLAAVLAGEAGGTLATGGQRRR